MKVKTLQILWHGKDPILSIDFYKSGLLATAGSDKDIKLWKLSDDSEGNPSATYVSSLNHHSSAVNVIRFSPTDDFLASGADGGEIIVWKRVKSGNNPEIWKVAKTLGFPKQDVLALEWSPDGSMLLAGCIDHKLSIWDAGKGSLEYTTEEHYHYVQGVAWDPLGKYCVSQSADKSFKVFSCEAVQQIKGIKGKIPGMTLNLQAEVTKAEVPISNLENGTDGKPAKGKTYPIFQDENLPSFFRRLCWSPDGSMIVVPSGMYKKDQESAIKPTTYIFSRTRLTKPLMHLPTLSKPSVGVRFCPVLFSLENDLKPNAADWKSPFNLKYKMVFAVSTLNSVFLYDTQHSHPIALLGGLHYAAITDLAWSHDGKYLVISSQDGYCSVAQFEEGELGDPFPLTDYPPEMKKYQSNGEEAPSSPVQTNQNLQHSRTTPPTRLSSRQAKKENRTRNSSIIPPEPHLEHPEAIEDFSKKTSLVPQNLEKEFNTVVASNENVILSLSNVTSEVKSSEVQKESVSQNQGKGSSEKLNSEVEFEGQNKIIQIDQSQDMPVRKREGSDSELPPTKCLKA